MRSLRIQLRLVHKRLANVGAESPLIRFAFSLRLGNVGPWLVLLCAVVASATAPLVLVPDPDGVQRAIVVMESYEFRPNQFIVERSKPVELTLRNESFLVPHNFVLTTPSGNRLIEVSVSSGETTTVRFTLTESGLYPFYCDEEFLFFPNHREEGMEGHILVR